MLRSVKEDESSLAYLKPEKLST